MAARKTAVKVEAVEHDSLVSALMAIQSEMPAFQRDKVNPHFGSGYLSLETLLPQVLEVVNAHGVLVTQFPCTIPPHGVPGLRTSLTHAKTGETLAGETPILVGKETPQAQGSALTYMKRYALMAALCITADKDDDANSAMPSRAAAPQSPVSAALPASDVSGADSPFGGVAL